MGPDDEDCITNGDLATLFCEKWGHDLKWINKSEENAPHESNFLKLDSSKMKRTFDWEPRWNIEKAIEKTVAPKFIELNKKAFELGYNH